MSKPIESIKFDEDAADEWVTPSVQQLQAASTGDCASEAADPASASASATATVPGQLDTGMMEKLLPDKAPEKRATWLAELLSNEFSTLGELAGLDESGWASLQLPLAVKAALKQAIASSASVPAAAATSMSTSSCDLGPLPPARITQVDCIVMDISGSMKARSALDRDKTREDVSKILFHTMVDRLITLELSHAVGLLAFGERITPVGITREYERFHDELGRLDANQGSTKLWDAVQAAGEMVEEYVAVHCKDQLQEQAQDPSSERIMKRIFVLTDGEDNSSRLKAWQVAQYLQTKGIVLDSIPLAGFNAQLQSLCTAAGGLCFDAQSEAQAMELFESGATLHVAHRDPEVVAMGMPPPPPITGPEALRALQRTPPARNSTGSGSGSGSSTTVMRSAVPATVYTQVRSQAQLLSEASKLLAEAANGTSSGTTTSSGSGSSGGGRGGGGGASTRRVLKEYSEIVRTPVDGWSVFVSEDNMLQWKAVLKGSELPGGSPYVGGTWMLTMDFPRDYPFNPPKVRFITPIYHCNITTDGALCLDLLKGSWSPAHTVSTVCAAISALLLQPNASDPVDAFKGQLCRDDPSMYAREAAKHTLDKAAVPYAELVQKYKLEA